MTIDVPPCGGRRILRTDLGSVIVSTVYLPSNHGTEREPLWFETMVFAAKDGEVTDYSDLAANRYATTNEAEAGHVEMVRRWTRILCWLGYHRHFDRSMQASSIFFLCIHCGRLVAGPRFHRGVKLLRRK